MIRSHPVNATGSGWPAAIAARRAAGSIFAFKPHAVQFHPVVDQPVAEPFGDLALQRLQLRIDEFDNLAGFDIDQVIVVGLGGSFIPGAAIAKIVAIENPGFFEQAHGAVHRGDGDARIDRDCALVQVLHVGMIFSFGQDARNYAALIRNAQPPLGTKCFNVDPLVHVRDQSKNE